MSTLHGRATASRFAVGVDAIDGFTGALTKETVAGLDVEHRQELVVSGHNLTMLVEHHGQTTDRFEHDGQDRIR
jgi:hypothetical protein